MADSDYSYNGTHRTSETMQGLGRRFGDDAMEDDVYNLLNDETFGENIEDYTWESERRPADPFHEDNINGGDYIHEATRAYSPNTGDEAELRLHENEMAYNIQQLVVDDDNNSNSLSDPAVVISGPAIPIQKNRSHLDELFGPSSPPALYDSHLMSPNMHNIWGSPGRESHFASPNLDNLFTQAKFSNHQTAKHVPGIGKSPCKAMTLEELENKILLRTKTSTTISASDLERKLRSGVVSPSTVGHVIPFTMPVPIPRLLGNQSPVSNASYPTKTSDAGDPTASPQSRLMEVLGRMTPPPHREARARTHNTTPITGSLQSPLAALGPPPLGSHGPHRPLTSSPLIPKIMRPPYPNVMHPPPHIFPIRGLNTNILPGQVLANALRMPHPGMPRPPFPFGPGMQRPPRMTYSDPMGQPGPRFSNDRGFNSNNNYKWFRGQAPNNRYYRDNHNYDNDRNGARDTYDGLMTQKEKEWVIKIQLLQLQTDNPYIDDYYYTTIMLKKARARMAKENKDGSKNGDMDLLLPQMAKVETREYRPAQFEGSLGRVTSASVHNPRKIIDVHKRDEDDASVISASEGDSALVSQKLRRFRQLLTVIENGYSLLLSVDDIEKEIPARPESSRKPLYEERAKKIQGIYDLYRHDDAKNDHFLNIVSFRKGKNLIARSFLLFSQEQMQQLTETLLQNISAIIRKDSHDEACVLVNPLKAVISQCGLSALVHYASILQHHSSVATMLLNKFGASVLCLLLTRADDILSDLSPLDLDPAVQTDWSSFIQHVAANIASISPKQLAIPHAKFPAIVAHFDRFIDSRSLGDIEDKLLLYKDGG